MKNLEEQIKNSFEAALYFGRQFDEWKEEQKLELEQPPRELLGKVIESWKERVNLLGFKRKKDNGFNTKKYLTAQQEYFVGAMVVLQQFYPKANFTGWMLLIESNRDILDFTQ